MRFEWNEEKNRRNRRKHGISFETASLVFEDPHALTQIDPFCDEEQRLITLGTAGSATLLFVVHTVFEQDDQEVIRIISARSATPRERKTYEEAYKAAGARNRGSRRHEKRRH